jgi:hypothetical protein
MSAEVVVAGSSERPRLGFIQRVLFGACGAALLIGFFMPWFLVGALLSLSGFALVFTSGQMVGMLAGANRFLLFAVPLLGVLLLGGSILGRRATTWIAVGGAGLILTFTFYSVIRIFVHSTGFGMWLVLFSTIGALSVGLLGVGRRSND